MGRTTELARLQELAWRTLGNLRYWQGFLEDLSREIEEAEENLRALRQSRDTVVFLRIPNTKEELESIENEIVNDYGAVMAARKAFRDE